MMNEKETKMKRLSFTLLILILFAFPSSARADIAPPIYPPGSNLEPGSEITQVRMVAETVLIDVQDDTTPHSLGSARVTADFTMRNLGSESESMAVRFPISASDGRSEYPELTNLAIKVNGKQISFRRANYPDIRDYNQDQDVPWAEFDAAFPVGQDLAIQVAYTLNGSGYTPFTAFYYILETGAGWKDTIGSADVILRLPYAASPQNVVMDMQIGWAETTPGGVFDGNEVRWHFDEFEPGLDGPVQDMEFALVAPAAWRTVLKERDNVAKNPDDGEAWGRLAMAYKQIFYLGKGYRTDAGGEELYRSSIEAYEKCLALKPDDAQWHAGFADLFAYRSYLDSWSGPTPDVYRALEEIHTALRLAPNDPVVLEIAQNISYMFPEGMSQNGTGYDFPWLTQTPTPHPPTPTIVPVYDPAVISGMYQSDTFTLANNKKAQLTLTLRADHSAEMESKYDNDPPIISTGSWTDNGDNTISIAVTDPNLKKTEIKFTVSNDLLQANEYPAFYGEAGIEMKRIVTATPVPPSTNTPEPGGAQPAPQSSSPLCGSAALAPLVAFIWLVQKRKQIK
jgi:tetratricopeptide (TPR) repeat protein